MIFSKTVNALEGSIWDKIIVFAIPMALTSLFQQLFNSADIAVIGRFSGSQALAAVGSTATIVNIFKLPGWHFGRRYRGHLSPAG